MSRLSDLIAGAVDTHTNDGTVNRYGALETIRPSLEDNDRAILIDEALLDRIKARATRARKSAGDAASDRSQLVLFPDLHRGYPVGSEIRLTDALSMPEFLRVMKTREDQIKQDAEHLKALQAAFNAVAPIWKRTPEKMFGEICAIYEQKLAA